MPQVIGKNPREARRSLLMESFNVGREHFKGVKNRTTAIVYKTEPPYTGISRYAQGTDIELWYKDSEGVDVRQMLRDYKIDSSKIIYEETPTTEEDVIEDGYIAVLSDGGGEIVYKTYVYKDGEGYRYVNATSQTVSWGATKWEVRVDDRGYAATKDDVVAAAEIHGSCGCMNLPGDYSRIYTIDEFLNMDF